MDKFDLIVIGGGPAGYNGAEHAAGHGYKVLLIEQEALGGTCLNAGCIPTKSLLASAKVYTHAKEMTDVAFDQKSTLLHKREVVHTLVSGVEKTLKRKKVKIVKGTAQILSKKTDGFEIGVGDAVYEATRLLIATGSKAIVPTIKGVPEALERGDAVTSTELLDMEKIPEKLVVIGAGIIGFEMAAYYQIAGSDVTVIEMANKVLGDSDAEISNMMQLSLEAKGVKFELGSQLVEVTNDSCIYRNSTGIHSVPFDKVLIAIGRKPNAEISGIEKLGLQIEKGALITDQNMKTNVGNVYAAGDVNGKVMLAHIGYRESEVAVNHMCGEADSMDYSAIPSVIYTSPEAAFVGLSETAAQKEGYDYIVKKVSINQSGRHVAENGISDGICKLIIDQKRGIIIGAAIMGTYASENIYSLSLMIQHKLPVDSLKKTIFPHPTVSEVIREALFA